jgi:hypothetical protein
VAAVNLGPDLAAQTVHSLAGCGVPQSARDFARILSSWNAKRWKKIEVLVLDEVGMLNADFLGTYNAGVCGIINTAFLGVFFGFILMTIFASFANRFTIDWLDVYVRKVRKCPLDPFGGIQLIFVGDFAQ